MVLSIELALAARVPQLAQLAQLECLANWDT